MVSSLPEDLNSTSVNEFFLIGKASCNTIDYYMLDVNHKSNSNNAYKISKENE